jgi:hypothetical protein
VQRGYSHQAARAISESLQERHDFCWRRLKTNVGASV